MPVNDRSDSLKPITPGAHAVLDYAVAATFFGLGLRYQRNNPAAAMLAFINGGMVLGLSVLTKYPGGLWPVVSFKTHRAMDIVQAATAALGPLAFGFADTSEAKTFYGQALSELGVVGLTDWDGSTGAD